MNAGLLATFYCGVYKANRRCKIRPVVRRSRPGRCPGMLRLLRSFWWVYRARLVAVWRRRVVGVAVTSQDVGVMGESVDPCRL